MRIRSPTEDPAMIPEELTEAERDSLPYPLWFMNIFLGVVLFFALPFYIEGRISGFSILLPFLGFFFFLLYNIHTSAQREVLIHQYQKDRKQRSHDHSHATRAAKSPNNDT